MPTNPLPLEIKSVSFDESPRTPRLHLYRIDCNPTTTKYAGENFSFHVVAEDWWEAERLGKAEITAKWSIYWEYGNTTHVISVDDLTKGRIIV